MHAGGSSTQQRMTNEASLVTLALRARPSDTCTHSVVNQLAKPVRSNYFRKVHTVQDLMQ